MAGKGRNIPVVIRQGGECFVPTFPVRMEEGDQFIIAEERCGWKCPEGKLIDINGYSDSGPILTEVNDEIRA